MKKTIDVWVTRYDIKKLAIECNGDNFVKGVLTYEVAEPTVTITPSQLSKAMKLDNFSQEAIQEVTYRLFKEN